MLRRPSLLFANDLLRSSIEVRKTAVTWGL